MMKRSKKIFVINTTVALVAGIVAIGAMKLNSAVNASEIVTIKSHQTSTEWLEISSRNGIYSYSLSTQYHRIIIEIDTITGVKTAFYTDELTGEMTTDTFMLSEIFSDTPSSQEIVDALEMLSSDLISGNVYLRNVFVPIDASEFITIKSHQTSTEWLEISSRNGIYYYFLNTQRYTITIEINTITGVKTAFYRDELTGEMTTDTFMLSEIFSDTPSSQEIVDALERLSNDLVRGRVLLRNVFRP